MSGEVFVLPGKRFADDAEQLTLADLNDLGSPVMRLAENSIGTLEFIYQDVFDIISEAALGIRTEYVFPKDLATTRFGVVPIQVPVPEVVIGDAIKVSPVRDPVSGLDINVQFWGECRAPGMVNLNVRPLVDGITILAGTVVTIIVFTPRRFLPGEGPLTGPMALPGSTGYLLVTPGYNWPDGDKVTTPKLDLTCQPTAEVFAHTVGRRELNADAISRIIAQTRGGIRFTGQTALNFAVAPDGAISFAIALGFNVALGIIPVVASTASTLSTILWGGYVDPVNVVNIVVRNLGGLTVNVPKGTRFQGRLI